MEISDAFDSESLNLLARAFSAAWEVVRHQPYGASPEAVRAELASVLLAAVNDGERDLERLREIGVEAVKYSPAVTEPVRS